MPSFVLDFFAQVPVVRKESLVSSAWCLKRRMGGLPADGTFLFSATCSPGFVPGCAA